MARLTPTQYIILVNMNRGMTISELWFVREDGLKVELLALKTVKSLIAKGWIYRTNQDAPRGTEREFAISEEGKRMIGGKQ